MIEVDSRKIASPRNALDSLTASSMLCAVRDARRLMESLEPQMARS